VTTPSVLGVLETALYVEDPARSQAFYERVLGCVELMREEGRLHALKVPGNQVLLLFTVGRSTNPTDAPGGRIPAHDGRGQLHVAFEIARAQIDLWRARLQQLGIAIESEVKCSRGGHSIYFRDPDHHLIELVTRDCWALD
jgi:catechol 2,3-dioxygenase-like lactoylglutathione lyase family enzyme